MHECTRCGGEVEDRHRYCPWCAAPQRLKLVEFFPSHPRTDPGSALRVSRYLGPDEDDRHVRFSVWSNVGFVEAAMSLDEAEAARLARFILDAPGSSDAGADTVRLDAADRDATVDSGRS